VTGPAPSVAAVRHAVRRDLSALIEYGPVLVACSGGADSLALAAALAFEAPKLGRPAGAVVVDHGWSPDSSARSTDVAATLTAMGLAPVLVLRAEPGPRTETAAREARYGAFDKAISETGAAAVLLAHTGSDQAEQVLLALARGSGTRSIAGMPRRRGKFRRPLLDLDRATTEAACTALGLTWWSDPSNADLTHPRARVRHQVMPMLEAALGPGIAAALKRTADLARQDSDALDAMAAAAADDLSVAALEALPVAVATRVLRLALLAAGSAPTSEHLTEVHRLVTDWHGQGPLDLPGDVQVSRRGAKIHIEPPSTDPRIAPFDGRP